MRWTGPLQRAAATTRHRAAVTATLLTVLLLVANVAVAATVDLEQAEAERRQATERQEQLQQDLSELLTRIETLKATREEQSAKIDRLGERLKTERAAARRAASQVAERYKLAYKTGTGGDPIVLMFGGSDPQEITERARLLSLMAKDSRGVQEAAEGAAIEAEALSDELETATAALADQTVQLSAAQDEARAKVAQAQAEIDELDQQIAAERERRAAERRRRQREAVAAAARERAAASPSPSSGSGSSGGGSSGGGSSGGGSGSAPVSGGIACPVGTPRNYSDTYGAPRSGGRSHMGVDILAPMRTPVYAYENGTISRMNNSSLGGISLYLQGSSGNQYFYTHLSGYASGVSVGQRVSAGQHIAYVGDTGNAAGIPHLHWEVQPGGSGNVNPYPFAYRACG